MYRRTALNPKTTAKQMKTNPMTSFHRVRAGFRYGGNHVFHKFAGVTRRYLLPHTLIVTNGRY